MSSSTYPSTRRFPNIDYGWSPSSYRAPPDDVLQLILRNVKGSQRRKMIRDYWDAGMFQELENVLIQDKLSDE